MRSKRDDEENTRLTEVMENGSFKEVSWSQVVVGDIVRVNKNQPFPADLVLIETSEEKGVKGSCYIETKNLDGETNMKLK